MEAPISVVLLCAIAVVAAVTWLVIAGGRAAEQRKRERLLRQTASGTATIVSVKTTHSTAGERPVVKLRLGVSFGAAGEEREIELELAVHALDAHRLQLGAAFPARFDPKQSADFSIDFGGVTGVSYSDL